MPRPDFPRTIVEFQQWFPDDEACAEYLFESRWPEGFRCPRCGHGHSWAVSKHRVLLECAACHLQTSLTAGTVLHKTRTPLHLWFWAAYLMSTPTPGTSALQLQRQLGLGPGCAVAGPAARKPLSSWVLRSAAPAADGSAWP